MGKITAPQCLASWLQHITLHPFVFSPKERVEKKEPAIQPTLLQKSSASPTAVGWETPVGLSRPHLCAVGGQSYLTGGFYFSLK